MDAGRLLQQERFREHINASERNFAYKKTGFENPVFRNHISGDQMK